MDQTARNEKVTLTIPMVDPEVVKHLRALHALGWGSKRIAHELGIPLSGGARHRRILRSHVAHFDHSTIARKWQAPRPE